MNINDAIKDLNGKEIPKTGKHEDGFLTYKDILINAVLNPTPETKTEQDVYKKFDIANRLSKNASFGFDLAELLLIKKCVIDGYSQHVVLCKAVLDLLNLKIDEKRK